MEVYILFILILSIYFSTLLDDEEELFSAIQNAEVHYPPSMSDKANSCIKLLLQRDPNKRLGLNSSPHGPIREHPFFLSADWDKFEKRLVKAPFKPLTVIFLFILISYLNKKKPLF
jgi:hypothetical protein